MDYRTMHCEDCKNFYCIEGNDVWGVCMKARSGTWNVRRKGRKNLKIKYTPTRERKRKACVKNFDLRDDVDAVGWVGGKKQCEIARKLEEELGRDPTGRELKEALWGN